SKRDWSSDVCSSDLFNRNFASEQWSFIPDQVWEQAFIEAEDQANYNQQLHILGSDINHQMIDIAKNNSMEAGLTDLIQWKQMQVKDLRIQQEYGYLVGNPPYGQRLNNKEIVKSMYKDLGKIMNEHPGWSVYILTAFKDFEKYFGRRATKKRKLFNGFIRTDYYQYFGKRSSKNERL